MENTDFKKKTAVVFAVNNGQKAWGIVPGYIYNECGVVLACNSYAKVLKLYKLPDPDMLDLLETCFGAPIAIDALFKTEWEAEF